MKSGATGRGKKLRIHARPDTGKKKADFFGEEKNIPIFALVEAEIP